MDEIWIGIRAVIVSMSGAQIPSIRNIRIPLAEVEGGCSEVV